ncbi:MAG: PQQ-binding-like beta-propeller repeat protein [Pseudomonadota bacterium]
MRKASAACASFAVLIGLAGCGGGLPTLPKISQLNPFQEVQKPLPGRRRPVLQTNATAAVPSELASADTSIVLAPQSANDAWSQPGGTPGNAPGNLAFSGSPKRVWSASAGSGSSTSGRVLATPIIYQGKAFTLDANGLVRAFNVASGARVWQQSLVPDSEKNAGSGVFSLTFSSSSTGGYGGGLAADNGRLYAASGFGRIVALDPATGKQLWERSLGTPVRASPTAVGDRVFVVTTEGRFFCLSGVDGAELWAVRGIPQQASRVINVSPAVDGNLVVVPYPSGDLMALNVADGAPAWTESLARSRGNSQLASLSNAARPVIDNGTVFAVGHAGRMIATQADSGERLWSIDVAGTQAPWVSGDSVFVVDTSGRLLAVSRSTGAVRWTAKLPGSRTWSGPTMAGNLLWLTSDQGALVGVDALTGRVTAQQSVGSKMFIPPIVAQGRMLLLTDSAQLVAYN